MYAENEIQFIEEKIRKDERERIIKLLEDKTLKLEFKEWASDDLISGVHRAIALIKGEVENNG